MKYEVLGMMFEGGARREVSLWSFVLLRGPLCNSCCMKEKGGKMERWKNVTRLVLPLWETLAGFAALCDRKF